MKTRDDFQRHFTSAVKSILTSRGHGAQLELAKKVGIGPSYMSDILSGRKKGGEELRREIALNLGLTYEELLSIGRSIEAVKSNKAPYRKLCEGIKPFTEAYAARIYQFAAEESGFHNSHFFSEEAFKTLRPPGWLEYLDGKITDGELYEIAREEMARVRGTMQEV